MYARHSLYNECEAQSRNGGLVHLTVASVYLELGGFRRCLEVKMVMTMIIFDGWMCANGLDTFFPSKMKAMRFNGPLAHPS